MSKKVKINIPIYTGKLLIVKAKSVREFLKKHDLHQDAHYGAVCYHTTNKKGSTKYVAIFDKKSTLSMIAHESTHIVNMIFYNHSVELDRLNDEPQAYLTGWVFDEIQKVIKAKK